MSKIEQLQRAAVEVARGLARATGGDVTSLREIAEAIDEMAETIHELVKAAEAS